MSEHTMEETTQQVAAELAKSYDFRNVRTVVEVRGGNSPLLKSLMSAYPHLRGVSVDEQDACSTAEEHLRRSGDMPLLSRLRFYSADFRELVPPAGEVYILNSDGSDWDEHSWTLALANTRDAMVRGTQVKRYRFAKDPRLLVIKTFTEEAEADLRESLGKAKLKSLTTIRLTTGHRVVECMPAD